MFGSKRSSGGMDNTTQISLIIFVLIIAFLVALWGWDVTDQNLRRSRAKTPQDMISESCVDLTTENGRAACENALDAVSEVISDYRQQVRDAR